MHFRPTPGLLELSGDATEVALDGLLVVGGVATGGGLFLATGAGAMVGFLIGSTQYDPYSGFAASYP